METVVGMVQDLQTFHGLFGLGSTDENTIALEFSTSYTSPQLMQLCQSKPLCIFHHHHGCIRVVDTDLDNRCRHKHVNLTFRKPFHDLIFLFCPHLSVQHLDPCACWQIRPHRIDIFCNIRHVKRLAFFHHRTDDIDLTLFGNLPCDKLVCRLAVIRANHTVFDRFSALW